MQNGINCFLSAVDWKSLGRHYRMKFDAERIGKYSVGYTAIILRYDQQTFVIKVCNKTKSY